MSARATMSLNAELRRGTEFGPELVRTSAAPNTSPGPLESALSNAAKIVVPRLADWCGIYLSGETDGRAAITLHTDPGKVAVVRHLLAKKRAPFDGAVFRLSEHNVLQYGVLRADVPLMIGTWGPRLAALAGEVADEVKVGGCVNPRMVPVMRERIAVGTAKVGRDANAVGIVLGAVTVVDEDGAAARRKAKEEVALYLPTVASLDPTVVVDPELLARMETAVQRGDRQAAAALISDELLRPFAFAGTPDEVVEHAEAIFAAGASRIEFGTPHGLTDARGVQLLGERVLSALRR